MIQAEPGQDIQTSSSLVMPRVAMLVGDNTTLHCGVKDYAHTLADALRCLGVPIDLLAPDSWGLRSVSALRSRFLHDQYDVVHLQYPSVGCRASLLPHLVGLMNLAKASAVTLHEHSALPVTQRHSLQIFRWTNSAIVWATEFEQTSFNRILGRWGALQRVIPLGSNVPASPYMGQRDQTVIYFGQIRPNKGLDDFLALAQQSFAKKRPFRFHIVGSVTSANQAYVTALRQRAEKQIEWSFDLSFEQVAALLSRSFVAYLPFPDGVSERRGSMLAAFANGLPVLSKTGLATTPELAKAILPVATHGEALAALDQLANDPVLYSRLSERARQYTERHHWHTIAMRHIDLYRELLGGFGQEPNDVVPS